MIKPYIELMRFHKPVGILLLLFPTWWALWIAASGLPSIKNIVIFTLGVILMRSAGCVINDIADRKLDLHVARTRHRPITAGIISVRNALVLFFLLCFAAFILVLLTNKLTIVLSFFAVITAAIYPFMKRYTQLPQLILGIAFSFSVPMAFAAQSNHISLSCVLLMLGVIAWTIAYDTQYAMVDRDDDLKIGIKSTAILFGKQDRLAIGILQLIFIALLVAVGEIEKYDFLYFIALGIVAILFIYQQRLIKNRLPEKCFRAFLNNQWIGLIIFIAVIRWPHHIPFL